MKSYIKRQDKRHDKLAATLAVAAGVCIWAAAFGVGIWVLIILGYLRYK